MDNKIALIGGSSAGIGKAIAIGFLQKGMEVIIIGRGSRLNDTKLELQTKFPQGKIHAIITDYSSSDSVNDLISSIEKISLKPDVLVLNTGGPKSGSFEDISLEDWNIAYQQQFNSSIMLMKAFIPDMVEKNGAGLLI
jgi:3-oxoacyl-[acyl-carrier protein] reductase